MAEQLNALFLGHEAENRISQTSFHAAALLD